MLTIAACEIKASDESVNANVDIIDAHQKQIGEVTKIVEGVPAGATISGSVWGSASGEAGSVVGSYGCSLSVSGACPSVPLVVASNPVEQDDVLPSASEQTEPTASEGAEA